MYKKIPLKEIAEINPSRPKFTLKHETEVSFIPMSDVTDNGRWSRRQVRQYQEVCSGYTCFLNGDVLFAKITPCMENGKGCLVTELKNGIGFGSTEFHVLRARTKGDPGFIYQWSTYRLFRLQAAASMTGSAGQQRVPASFLETFNMPAIDKPEQSKIAEILSTVDRVIEQTEALIAKQQRIKTGLMQDLLTRGIDEHGNIRSEETHQFKDSPLGMIPVEWEVVPLGIAVGRNKGSVQIGPFGSQLHAEDYKEVGIPIITVEHLMKNRILHKNLPLVGEDDYRRLVKYTLREGDLVFSRVGSIDRCSYVSKDEDGWLFSGRCLRVRSGKEINSRYLSYQLNYDNARNWILNNSVGTTMACLNTSILSMTPIVLPQQSEQVKVAEILDSISDAIQYQLSKRFKLDSLKTALMQDLLTGKVRVTPLLDETEVINDESGQNISVHQDRRAQPCGETTAGSACGAGVGDY